MNQIEISELLALVERLSKVNPWYDDESYGWACVGCGQDIWYKRKPKEHKPDCPFLLLEQWKAESE